MDSGTIRTTLQDVFRDTFEDPGLELHDDMTAAQVEKWDSLSHIDLIHAVERAFKIRLSMREVRSLNNVGALLALIQQKAS